MLAFFTQGELLLTLEGQDGRLLARWGAMAYQQVDRTVQPLFAR